MRTLGKFLLAIVTLPLAAQTVVVGSQHVTTAGTAYTSPPFTFVDLSNVATADGTVSTGSIRWDGGPCTNAFKLKFYRPSTPLSARTITLLGERGPFTSQPGTSIVPVNPPLAIKKGDLIGVTVLRDGATCGSPLFSSEPNAEVMLLAGDIGNGALDGGTIRNRVLAVRATDTSEVLEGVITAAGSVAGGFGSYFRTSLQITGRPGSTETLSGKLVFRRAGATPSAITPTVTYTVTGGKAVSYNDIVQHMGTSGLGSIDVISTSGAPPLVTARVYNDEGAAGTSGFTEDLIAPEEALHQYEVASLIAPADLTNFRGNIGVRTFAMPVELTVKYGSRAPEALSFPANTFQQLPLATLISVAPDANDVITFTIMSGDAIIYLSTTDNRTNDSSIRFAKVE